MKVIVEFKQIGVDLDVNESDSRDTAISKYIQSMGGIQSTLNYILRNITFYKDEIKEVEEIKDNQTKENKETKNGTGESM